MRQLLLQASLLGAALVLGAPTLRAQAIQPRLGAPVPGLSPAQITRFNLGKVAFDAALTPAAGLGPGFNDNSCNACHLGPTSGGSSNKFVTRFGKAASGGNPFDPLANLGGSLLQAQTISPSCQEVVPAQADVIIQRITPPTFGFGLVEAIDDADIQYNELFPPPGISGKAHMVHALEDPIGAPDKVGRFGWKAQVATILTFSGDASLNEMGLTNRLVPQETAPNGDPVLLAMCDSVPDPEDPTDAFGFDGIDRQTDFQKFLAPPPQTPKFGMTGEAIFRSVKCSDCHVSAPFTTRPTAEAPLANQTLKPYTDFLLHDVGSLGDGIVQGQATENELRTPPLWGILHRGNVALLHDGRATSGTFEQNVASAVGFHDGEAAASRGLYNGLNATQKSQLAQFLASLGRAEFDYEGNNNVDEFDWFFLQPLLNGPVAAYTPDDIAAVADIDQDGDFDIRDFGMMQRAFTGP